MWKFVSCTINYKLQKFNIMKKIYFLALTLGVFTFAQAQTIELEEDFESYNLGPISPQSDDWRTWSGDEGTPEDALVTNNRHRSGAQGLYIDNSTVMDPILLIPSAPVSGIYTVQFYAYLPAGKSGYWNMQAALTPEGQPWNQALMGGNVYLYCYDDTTGGMGTPGEGGITGQIDCSAFDAVFSYPEDEWFKVTAIYDLTNQSWDLKINDDLQVVDYPFEFGAQTFLELAGIDFYSASSNNEMYIDDITLATGILSTENFAEDVFSVYPNPMSDVLNISSKATVDEVTIYDVLGKVVLVEKPGKIAPSINTSGLPSGTYMVKVKIGNNSKIVKILK